MMRLIAVGLAVALAALAFACWRLSLTENELTQAQRVIGTLSAGI